MNNYISVELGGKVRGLKFGVRAILTAAKMLNISLSELKFDFSDFKTQATVIYCGLVSNCALKREDIDFTIEDVEIWADDLSLIKLTEIFKVFADSLSGEPSETKKSDKKKVK